MRFKRLSKQFIINNLEIENSIQKFYLLKIPINLQVCLLLYSATYRMFIWFSRDRARVFV